MTWKNHHRRAEVLREVIHTADERRDGSLPMDVPGVIEIFPPDENGTDEITLLGCLQLRWHTSLSGRIELALSEEPLDLEAAVIKAWQATADALPGIRLILDRYAAAPTSPEMAAVMRRAAGKEHAMIALMAGQASSGDDLAVRTGEAIALRARASYVNVPSPRDQQAPSLVERLKAVLAA